MSRTPLPFHVDDISAMARSLRSQLSVHEGTPSHVELMNMLVKSTGYRNFQHFRAQAASLPSSGQSVTQVAGKDVVADQGASSPVDLAKVQRVARYVNTAGQLIRWPGKYSHREPCLWVLWSKLPPRQDMAEKQVNELLAASHLFGDHALLRREMFDRGMLTRTPDGRIYRRIEQKPADEALALLRHLGVN